MTHIDERLYKVQHEVCGPGSEADKINENIEQMGGKFFDLNERAESLGKDADAIRSEAETVYADFVEVYYTGWSQLF
jgi:archaellum component FlaC